jgi:C-terminal processing protease CtpA/Prc
MKIKTIKYVIAVLLCAITEQTLSINSLSNKQELNLSERSLHNISVFNKVYGYVRHFSPALAVDTFFGWEDLLLKYLPLVETAKSDTELCNVIQSCFSQLEPNLVAEPFSMEKRALKPSSKKCNGFYVHRYNKGWGNRNENATKMKFLYTSKIEKSSIDNEVFTTNFEDIFISIPLCTCINDSVYKLYNSTREPDLREKIGKYNIRDKYVRIGILIIVWNVQEYFYPYLKEMNINNENIFKKYIEIVTSDMEEKIFFETLEFFGAEYKDGHAAFMPLASMSKWPDYVPPIKIQLLENKLILTYASDSLKYLLAVGDEVTSIDNMPAMDYFLKKQKKVSSATPTWNKYVSEKELLTGYKDTSISLELQKNGVKTKLLLNRTIGSRINDDNARARPDMYKIRKGYYYINLFNMRDSALKYISDSVLPHATGVVFDCRGYPKGNVTKYILSHLTNDTLFPSFWTIPIMAYPNQNYPKQDTSNATHWITPPIKPKFTNNIVFIVDGSNISAAESILAMVEYYKLGKIVGEQTAGTNGNINSFVVYGLYQFWHTEMYVSRYDGSQHHGVGIIPQVQVKPATLNDIIEGKDTFVIEAIRMLK